jgi:O-antigen ligase
MLAMIFASPWYYGAVTWQAQTYFWPLAVVILVLATLGATLRKETLTNPLVWSMAALLLLALLQTVQLPDWLWQRVSTGGAFEHMTSKIETEFLLPARLDASDSNGDTIRIEETPRTLSIHWVQTRASLSMFAVVLAFLMAAGVLFRSRTWEVVLLSVLAASGLSVALLGILQSVAWNKWTLLPMPTQTYFATFVSRNSAPQFLAIGLGGVLGLLAWWNGTKSDEADKKYYVRYPAINAVARFRRRLEELVTDLDVLSLVCVFAATLIFVAVLAAGSRGGILSCMASAVLTLSISLGTKKSYARSVGLVTVMGCGAVILLTTLELDSAIWERMDSVNEEAHRLNNGRFTVWQMLLSQPSCWLPGCGLGNFHFAILPAYRGAPTAWFYHAENIYLELLAEFGIVGLSIGLFGIGWLLLRIRWCVVTGRRSAPSFVAATLAVTAVGLQSLVDFSLIIPAICLPLATLVGCFLGRSFCIDYGKRPKHGETRGSTKRTSGGSVQKRTGPVSAWGTTPTTIGLVSLVLFSIWVSAKPLAGFAFAEKLNRQLSQLDKSSQKKMGQRVKQLIEAIDVTQAERFADHPEVNLQIGRLLQEFAGDVFAEQLQWPAETTVREKATLSEPANIAAAYRAKSDPRMATMRELSQQLPQQIESLRRSAYRMAAAASVCSFDWRSGLGVVRSDLNWFTPEARARNYARLSQITGHSNQIPASIGAAALLAGEKQVGYRFLHDYLERIPSRVISIANGFVRHLPNDSSPAESARELLLILPESLISRVEVAEDFSRKPDLETIAKQLAANIDLDEMVAEAELQSSALPSAKPWILVAWLAKERSATTTQIEALLNATAADPMNHELRFSLAELLSENGRKSESIQQAERAARQSPDSDRYREFIEKNR